MKEWTVDANLLEHAGAGIDLFHDAVVKDGLSQDREGLVLALDAEFLGLEIDLHVLELSHSAFLFGSLDHPRAKLVVAVGFAIAVFVIIDNERALEVVGKLFGTSLDGLFGSVHRPLDFLDVINLIDLLGVGLDAAGKFIVAASVDLVVAVLFGGIVRVAISRASVARLVLVVPEPGFFPSPAFGFFRGLVLLALLGLVLEDKRAQLQAEIHVGALAACLTVQHDAAILDLDVCFRVLAFLAENESGDEAIKIVLELGSLVSSIDDPTIVVGIRVGLGTKLEAKILDNI